MTQEMSNQEIQSVVENDQIRDYEHSFTEEAINNTSENGESNSSEVDQVSNGLENFGVDESSSPELFNSQNEIAEKEDLLSTEISEEGSEDDDLEIPAFLRRQQN